VNCNLVSTARVVPLQSTLARVPARVTCSTFTPQPTTSVGGTIAPGPTLGALMLDALTLDSASRVVLDIRGTTPGACSRNAMRDEPSIGTPLLSRPCSPQRYRGRR